jgi:serine/threonine protein phosphatase PrpC
LEGPIQVVDQGAWSIKGRRKAQEDAFILHEVHDTKERSVLLAGVADGHLGNAASRFVQSELPDTFSASLNLGNGAPVQSLLENAWNQCCDSYRTSCLSANECVAEYDPKEGILMAYTGSQDAVAGTTVTVFALDKQNSHLAALNCGDSRGLAMDSNGQLVFQTVDHKPETEIDRLTEGKNQGFDYSIPKCRVARWTLAVGEYDYAVARSLEGPFATSKGIVSSADVSFVQALTGMTVFAATDGLWEVIDSEEACRIVSRLRSQKTSAGDTAKALCSLAYEKASSDNVSVVVLYLD